ncbi:MAG: hypothetical protein COY80_01200 [Candidatus Pacebacteria bacterium CG_4_10_14_0_8_um_filter_42_14]|nr:MAG: hypothetical protein COY80_01200 [Candidatus Pacebacteria bacterium CG_4_10_14_0_8_um_filter_42_14]
MLKSWLHRHQSKVENITHKLHWPHRESKAEKTLRIFQTAILYLALILLGYLIAQLRFLA